MGPQLYRCGDTGACVLNIRRIQASMGPQLYRCGDSDMNVSGITGPLASMGPQLYRCGDKATDSNAASLLRSFNGAATLSLRRPVYGVADLQQALIASMGPQLYRCGDPWRDIIARHIKAMLQWGRNFIVAETYGSFGCACVLCSLQWGRNFIVAETKALLVAQSDPDNVASMGPQLYRCGDKS